MGSLKMTPAKESAPAGTTTPTSAHADAPATEEKLSVAQYHLLQQQKRAHDSADTPSAILYGSSLLNTYGSIPIDYGSDIEDVPMEEAKLPRPRLPSLRRPKQRPTHSLDRGKRVMKIRVLQIRSVRVLEMRHSSAGDALFSFSHCK
ncbi:hypothetical protein F442_23009 [Phytophthora nicotianae P10297]|uniref:Uncharacterized protein n=3 Tax=Phytophthora nicotianae TaxID=4792 RepID=W2XYE7_PHYNI|nr:hypothetical protein L914_21537 [Phytophthora nicotianae]ETO66108.1 hypothetical protein F444_16634 [Phytophthora nicotianae P1976]ETP27711.1 hypothetical protein F442_23009 [Phytophthora nicotianae P10297]